MTIQKLYWLLVMPSCLAMAIAGFYIAYKVGKASDAIVQHYDKIPPSKIVNRKKGIK